MTKDEAAYDNATARQLQYQGLIGQSGQEVVRGCLTSRSDNAITYMRQRRKELVVKLQALADLQSELANIDKALAALGDVP